MKNTVESLSLTRIMLTGAISVYEAEGKLIEELLIKQDNHLLYNAWAAIGSALYWSKDQVEIFIIPAVAKE